MIPIVLHDMVSLSSFSSIFTSFQVNGLNVGIGSTSPCFDLRWSLMHNLREKENMMCVPEILVG